MKYSASCHCKKINIEVEAPERLTVQECNCSICRKTGHLHLIVPRSHLQILSGAESTTLYQFNTKVARHYFCRHCGVKVFYVPRSNPQGYSVNARCLEPVPDMTVETFDGRNWEDNAHTLSHLTPDPDATDNKP
ncbi:MAG: GFA family protein [Gammaproteobacteria bacterium]|nr:GFA family protein [Gammaproteobacteria bacterium]